MLVSTQTLARNQKPIRLRPRVGLRPRGGYALLACLLTIAVSSSIVVAIFDVQRVHCAEAAARRQLTELAALQQAAQEHALAVLIDQPAFRGQLGPFTHPNFIGRSYAFQVADGGSGIQVTSLVQIDGRSTSGSITLSPAALDARRASLGLGL